MWREIPGDRAQYRRHLEGTPAVRPVAEPRSKAPSGSRPPPEDEKTEETSMSNLPGLQFPLGEEIGMLRDTLAKFAAKEIAPRAGEIDRTDQFPMDLWRKFGDSGG